MTGHARVRVEREIATAAVRSAVQYGYTFGIDNGDAEEIRTSTEEKTLAAMFQTDDERLYLYSGGQAKPVGWVYFVYGNDGWDVISDYTVNLEELLTAAHAVSAKYA
jgi:hypothetical protein